MTKIEATATVDEIARVDGEEEEDEAMVTLSLFSGDGSTPLPGIDDMKINIIVPLKDVPSLNAKFKITVEEL